MNTQWQIFLESSQAKIKDGAVQYFNIDGHKSEQDQLVREAIESMDQTRNSIADLSHLDLVHVSGPDAKAFLQGQLSCDLDLVVENQSQFGACCNLQGRIIANFIIFKNTSGYILVSNEGLGNSITETLKKYAVFSKVTIEIANPDLILLGFIQNTPINQKYEEALASTKLKEYFWPSEEGATTLKGFIFGTIEEALSQWQVLSSQFNTIGKNAWDLSNINSGTAFIHSKAKEQFTPQAINFELVQGINFTKGCYTGQEVIARLHYRGSSKRRCYIAHSSEGPVNPGTEVFNQNQKAIGHVLESAWNATGQSSALISLAVSSFEEKKLSFNQKESTYLTLQSPPYAIPK